MKFGLQKYTKNTYPQSNFGFFFNNCICKLIEILVQEFKCQHSTQTDIFMNIVIDTKYDLY